MVSRAAAYHSGFNSGFNLAEAVNFALPRWLNIAQHVKSCKCVGDSVRINMGHFLAKLLSKQEVLQGIKKTHLNQLLKHSKEEKKEEELLQEMSTVSKISSSKSSPPGLHSISTSKKKRQKGNQQLNISQSVYISRRLKEFLYKKRKHRTTHVVCARCKLRRKVPLEEYVKRHLNKKEFLCEQLKKDRIKCFNDYLGLKPKSNKRFKVVLKIPKQKKKTISKQSKIRVHY